MSETLNVRNPRTGALDYQITVQQDPALANVVKGLRRAQPEWASAGVAHRVDVMRQWQTALRSRQADIVAALATDTGRSVIAQGEFFGLIGMIDRWCALAPDLLEERSRQSVAMPDVRITDVLTPFSVVGAISPWNFPLLLSFIDVVPALLAGCSAVIKPSEVTPRFAAPVMNAINDVPALASVLQCVSGDGRTGAALVAHVDVIAFTGSVATGKKVAAAAAEHFIPAFLELGGKDPAILLDDSPVDRAATAILRASVAATGQACQSLERIYVNTTQHDAFIEVLSEKAAAVPLSYPDPDEGIIGPLIFDRQADIIASHIEDAVAKGAVIHTGGVVHEHGGGKWIEPTVLSNVNHDMAIMTEETFGPIMPVMRFDSEADALTLANDSRYGLSGAVFGGDDAAIQRVARQLNVGGVSINDAGMTTMIFEACKSAFGESGIGPSRMGPTGLTRFLRHKALYHNAGTVNPITAMAEQKSPRQ
ncbi:MAG: aldehyde dehydrogenase family protein [Pseudomonadota bacterium]